MATVDRKTLDLLSTSQTPTVNELLELGVSWDVARETEANIQEAEMDQARTCSNNAPYIFYVDQAGKAHLVQGCCNDWTCARCGVIRAKKEYGRMVHGAKEIHGRGLPLYFVTLTCRGREMTVAEAERTYLKATNAIITAWRTRCKRAGQEWAYAAVTERQKRRHPHSHFQVTWIPEDATPYAKGKRLPNGSYAKHDCLYSQWLTETCTRNGLGKMTDITVIRHPIAVAVYQSKYMFKDAARTVWPKGWRRVRYSNSWPKLPIVKPELAFPLVHYSDWKRMENLGVTVYADSPETLEAAYARLITCVRYKERGRISETEEMELAPV